MAETLKKKRKARRRSAPERPIRFDASLNVKVEKVKKAALVQYARTNQRSVGFVVQSMLDQFLTDRNIPVPSAEEADQILSEALNG